MREQSKAAIRRKQDPRFANRWFVGRAIDLGCGDDPLRLEDWPLLTEVVLYDKCLGHSDAQYLQEIEDESFDVVHASHILEHLPNPRIALTNWLRVLKPSGFIVCTVPDEYLYECGCWPSKFNPDHKESFTTRYKPVIPFSIHLPYFLVSLPVDIEHLTLLTDKWNPDLLHTDQTLTGAECSIEFVVRKPGDSYAEAS